MPDLTKAERLCCKDSQISATAGSVSIVPTSIPLIHTPTCARELHTEYIFFPEDEGVKPCLTTLLHHWKQNSNFTVMFEAFLQLIFGFRETSQHLNCRHATVLASVEGV